MTYQVAQKIERARLTGAQLSATGKQVIGSWQSGLCLPASSKLFSRFLLSCLVYFFLPSNYTHSKLIHNHISQHNTAKMSDQGDEISQVTYEQLAGIEDEFEEIDTQISTSLACPKNPLSQQSH